VVNGLQTISEGSAVVITDDDAGKVHGLSRLFRKEEKKLNLNYCPIWIGFQYGKKITLFMRTISDKPDSFS